MVVASALMSMGMIMLPPVIITMPIKLTYLLVKFCQTGRYIYLAVIKREEFMFFLLSVFGFVLLVLALVFVFIIVLVDKLKSLVNPAPRIGDEKPKIKKKAEPERQEPVESDNSSKPKFTVFETIVILQGFFIFIEPTICLLMKYI